MCYLGHLSSEYSLNKNKYPITVNSVTYVTYTSGKTGNKNTSMVASGSIK